MPVVLHHFTGVAAVAGPGRLIALELARQCVDQYHLNIAPGPGGGIAAGTCWAAVATTPVAHFPASYGVNPANPPGSAAGAWGAMPYGVCFGASQMANVAAGVGVPLPGLPNPSGHAERNALIVAGNAGGGLHLVAGAANTAVLFVQLSPCGPCGVWLGGGGGGVANPYPAAAGGVLTLHVWHRWMHLGQVANMTAWNGGTRAAKLADINNNW
jgi:hypothetical protein